MKTYEQIQREAAQLLGVMPNTVRKCWIAEVKRSLGLTRGPAPNTGKGVGAPPCPSKHKIAITRIINGFRVR